jgi:hypothetical protein
MATRLANDRSFVLTHRSQAVTDFPAACFGPELIAAYPEAKVVLTTRDPDAWVESVRSTLNWRYNDKVLYWLSFVDWGYRLYAPMYAMMWDRFFEGDFDKNAKLVFEKHSAELKSLVPAGRLLEYDVREGWGPLCRFLEVDKPDQPFPSGNDKDGFRSSCRSKDLSKAGKFVRNVCLGVIAVFVCGKMVERVW